MGFASSAEAETFSFPRMTDPENPSLPSRGKNRENLDAIFCAEGLNKVLKAIFYDKSLKYLGVLGKTHFKLT